MALPQRKLQQYRTPSDLTFLEDLLLSSPRTDASVPSIQQRRQSQAPLAAARRKKKVPERLRHATAATVRQALFPCGPGSYPTENSPLRGSGPVQGVVGGRQLQRDADDLGYEDGDFEEQEKKRREMCWRTSFPAEYLHPTGTQRDATKQTLAFHEQQLEWQQQQQLELRRQLQQRVTRALDICVAKADETLLKLQKQVVIREGLLGKLHDVVKAATHKREFDVSKGNELLHLLLEVRDASVEVMQHLAEWHYHCIELLSPAKRHGGEEGSVPQLPAFVFEKANYCVKMVSDLNFLGSVAALGGVLGVDPARMKQNPFMMPEPIPQREFGSVQSLTWCDLPLAAKCVGKQQQPRRKGRQEQPEGQGNQIAERVAEAETYLIWCLFNLQPPPSDQDKVSTSDHLPEPRGQSSWQKRAEKQLELLSQPLESTSGRAYVMDSSPMMKRKGVLPSLPLSPPKTLTELMDSVRQLPVADPPLSMVSELLAVEWNGAIFRCSTRELEALGSLSLPPHQIITIVAASVLILLSPSDRLPRDLSWTSCRKMLLGGVRLVDRLVSFDASSVPEFKWKALVPFLQNEQFQPRALAEVSNSAACLCAWVLAGMRQSQALAAAGEASDVDRLDLLGELEVDDVDNGSGDIDGSTSRPAATATGAREALHNADAVLAPRPKSKGGKRVSIGNAEILFINENQPVSMTPTPLHSRPSSSSLSLSPATPPAASVLVRTSPWTFKGVTYFVSFFLEQEPRTALSIKLYEPMSSVESQIFVTEEDLRADFGDAALSAFRRREYRDVCELILSQLDRMMGELSARSDRSSRSGDAEPTALDLLPSSEETDGLEQDRETQEEEEGLVDAECGANEQRLEPARQTSPGEDAAAAAMDEEAAAVRIQSLARQQSAKKTCARLAEERHAEAVSGTGGALEEKQQHQETETKTETETEAPADDRAAAILRIQCAARQKQARDRALHVRYSRQKKVDEEERRRRILTRTPTGMPSEQEEQQQQPTHATLGAFAEAEGDGEEGEAEEEGAVVDGGGEGGERAVEEAEEAEMMQRPETSMSYASEQFEDDFDE
jgi:hypothetical protein